MMRLMATLVSSVVLTAGVLTACGGGADDSSAPAYTGTQAQETARPTTAQPAGPEIVISDFAYTVPVSVKPGEQVTIVNEDSPNHTFTADDIKLFDVRVSGGGMSTLTAPTTPGTYPIHCKYHADMHGSLTVQ